MLRVLSTGLGLTAGLAFALLAQPVAAQEALDAAIAPNTAVPVEFTRTLDAARLKPGDPVSARTMQVVYLADGSELPKGAAVLGRITAARKASGETASLLSFQLDRIAVRGSMLKTRLFLRAMADPGDSNRAAAPTPPEEMNLAQTRTLVGGDHVTPFEEKVYSSDGEIARVVGENRKNGVFERLVATPAADDNAQIECTATETLQSVAIFSGSACGLYGFDGLRLTHSGRRHGSIELESSRHTIKLEAMTTALLQVAAQ